jgi:intracellular septation protein
MKFLFDLFPVILFFIAFKFADIYVATGVAMLATLAQIAWVYFRMVLNLDPIWHRTMVVP